MYCRTDDPLADFARCMAEQQKLLDKLPRCIECDRPIQDEYLYDINGDYVCQKCMDEHYRKRVDDVVG